MNSVKTKINIIGSSAVMSGDNQHRYELVRAWDTKKPQVMFIGLNPSRADSITNDPTIRRCINFASDWGYGSMSFLNLYSYRTPYVSTVPKKDNGVWWPLLPAVSGYGNVAPYAVGPLCDFYLEKNITESARVIICWGRWSFLAGRDQLVLKMIPPQKRYCLGLNNNGTPKHPLYLPSITQPELVF